MKFLAFLFALMLMSAIALACPTGGLTCNDPEPWSIPDPLPEGYEIYNCYGGTFSKGNPDCRVPATDPTMASARCRHFWHVNAGNVDTGISVECYAETAQPPVPQVCVSTGSRYGTNYRAETKPVLVAAPAAATLMAAKYTAWWDDPRPGGLQPSLLDFNCATLPGPGTPVPAGPTWYCDDLSGDAVMPLQVHAGNNAEAIAWAIALWWANPFNPLLMDPEDVLCKTTPGPILWQCGGFQTNGMLLPPTPVQADSWQTATDAALLWYLDLSISADRSTIECTPSGNYVAEGADVRWYCTGEDYAAEGGSCALPVKEIVAPSDEYEWQLGQYAASLWMSDGYSASWSGIDCEKEIQPWQSPPANASMFQCSDASGVHPDVAVPALGAAQAVAWAQKEWGIGVVAAENTLCATPGAATATCSIGIEEIVMWECGGVSKSGAPLPAINLFAEYKTPEPVVRTSAMYEWQRKGHDPDYYSVLCEPTEEPTDPGWPDDEPPPPPPPPDPDLFRWHCHGTAIIPFPHTVTALVWALPGKAALAAAQKWQNDGKVVQFNSIVCQPSPP